MIENESAKTSSFEEELAVWMEVLQYMKAPGAVIIAGLLDKAGFSIFAGIWIIYAALPFLDYFLPIDNSNLSKEKSKKFEKDWRFFIPVYSVIILNFCYYIYLLNGVSNGTIGATPKEFILYAISGAALGGINTIAGHELIHKKSAVHKTLGLIPWF